MKLCLSLLSISSLLFLTFCVSDPNTSNLQSGDFLFVSAKQENLSGAIDKVTQTDKNHHYSHIAMVEVETDSTIWVIHAGTKNGSERVSLQTFLSYYEDNTIDIFRLKDVYHHTIPSAIESAKTFLGKPYNYSYILSDTALYCSDLIQRSFAKDSIFGLYPMTFKDSETGSFNEYWVEFYKDLGIEIPEGKPGCNPNQMAVNEKLEFIERLNAP
ncbi:MAG: YiiX/YebB-like N1pC/P60 family cysteine hydrolase [Brumimicrobium sp.]